MENGLEEKLLEGHFYLFPSCRVKYEVIVTRQNIMYSEYSVKGGNVPKHFTSILMENIIGCHMYESRFKDDNYCCFTVVSLIKNKKGQRQRKKVTFCIFHSDDKQENLTIAETWTRTLAWLIRDPSISVEELQEKETFPPQRKFYLLINPKSGKGKSLELFHSTIEPIFKDAMIKYDVLVTEYAGHVNKIAKEVDHKLYNAIIICSGDGLAFEYINGVMERSDWGEVLKTPMGILPTGSGNALSASINHAADECFGLVNSIYILLKGQSHPMDLFSCTNHKETVYGFLSVTWGLLSDVDIESEKYRALGVIRFTIGAIQRIIGLRHYEGTLYYLPDDRSSDDITQENKAVRTEGDLLSDKDIDNKKDIELKVNSKGQRPVPTIPPLSEECGVEWLKVEDEFILVGVQSISHLGSDMHSAPGVLFNDGLLDVQFIKKGTTRKTMLNLMGAFETGDHLNCPDVTRLKVKAYRIVPRGDRVGHIAVDGEEIEYGPVQGEILQSMCNIILLKK